MKYLIRTETVVFVSVVRLLGEQKYGGNSPTVEGVMKPGDVGAPLREGFRVQAKRGLKKAKKRRALVALPLAAVLAACSLNGQMNISADGQAQITMSAVVERSLVDSDSACVQVLQSTFTDFLHLKDVQVTSNDDTENLKCQAHTSVNLNQAGWDGQEGRPLWQAGPSTYQPQSGATEAEKVSGPQSMKLPEGQHRLFLPLSQGSQGVGVTQAVLADLSGQIKPTLTVTMPEKVTHASSGKIEGNTVTLTGASDFVKDLDVISGGNWWQALSTTTRVLIWGVGGVVVVTALMIAGGRRRLKRRKARRVAE